MKTWYTIAAKADKPDEGEVSILDGIGYWGVSAAAFIADLKKLGNVKTINLTVNSPGGSVFDGLAMYNALAAMRDKGVTINGKVMGIAASAASFVLMAANKIEMPENSMLMVHYASGLAFGNADEMRETADILDKIDTSIVAIYTARTGKSEEDVRALLEAETYMTAQEAKDLGFADTITENVKATASFEIDRLPENVQKLFLDAKQVEPKVETKPEPTMTEQIAAVATEQGFGALAEHFALNFSTVAEAHAAMSTAREIQSLCNIAKVEDKAEGFIRAKKSLDAVRADICALRAIEDEQKPTNSARREEHTPPNTQPVAGLKTADVWAARRKSQQGA